MMLAPNSARRRSGFTLVELMISMTIGLFVVGGAYYITRTTSRMFAEQLRRAETHLTLRSAIELMRRDIARAGFAGVRHTAEMPGCNATAAAGGWAGTVGTLATDVSPVALAAVWIQPVPNAPPQLYLSGNFSTADQYTLDTNSSALGLQFVPTQYAFQRSFTVPIAAGTLVADSFLGSRFQEAFMTLNVGRMVNVLDLGSRKSFLRQITAVTQAPPSVTLGTPLPVGSGCQFNLPNAVAAPISMFRYEVVNTADDPEFAAAVSAGGTYMTGGHRSVLVRREIDLRTMPTTLPPNNPPTAIPGTTRAIVDFLDPNGFALQVVRDTAPQNTGSLPVLARVPANLPLDANNVPPESIRSLVVQIEARSPDHMTVGEAHEQSRTVAGRRVARFEVFLPNMARNPGRRP